MAKEKNKTELPKVMEGELQARLIKLREDAGYDVSQMAAVLCLSEEVIVNLENEAFDLLPEPPYVRGYLRNYAKLGDDDSSELITRYESLRGADAAELDFQVKPSINTIGTTTKSHISPVWGQVIILAILLGGIALLSTIPGVKNWTTEKWNSFSSQLEPNTNNPSLLGDLPVPAPLPDESATDLAEKSINSEPVASTETTAETQTNSSTTDPQATTTENTETENTPLADNIPATDNIPVTDSTSETVNIPATETNTNSTEAESDTSNITNTNEQTVDNTSSDVTDETIPSTDPNGLINIKLVFNKEVWLRVKDKDNKTVFEGLNRESTEKSIDLTKPLTFRVGNAQGLSLFVDGKAVDISSYINGSIANFSLE